MHLGLKIPKKMVRGRWKDSKNVFGKDHIENILHLVLRYNKDNGETGGKGSLAM